eukprot:GHVP01065345.1.p1 GENE.GHVP01065345.1~~GHVP01065345.1.p1  ORF type:complete len:133 (-),score=21.81 GHVP01065345.1:863-1261(-)
MKRMLHTSTSWLVITQLDKQMAILAENRRTNPEAPEYAKQLIVASEYAKELRATTLAFGAVRAWEYELLSPYKKLFSFSPSKAGANIHEIDEELKAERCRNPSSQAWPLLPQKIQKYVKKRRRLFAKLMGTY